MSLDFWKQFWPVAHRKGIPNWLDWSHVLGGCFGAAISITNNSLGEGQWWGVGTWLYHCLWRTETKTEYRIDIGEISRIWILAVHWFIQQIFIKYLLCAWHPFWAKETPGWTQQIRKGPSSLWSDVASFIQSYFSPAFSGFSVVHDSLLQRIFVLCLESSPYKQVCFWGIERGYTHSVCKIRGAESACRLFKLCPKIYKHDLHSCRLQPKNVLIMPTTTKLHKDPH